MNRNRKTETKIKTSSRQNGREKETNRERERERERQRKSDLTTVALFELRHSKPCSVGKANSSLGRKRRVSTATQSRAQHTPLWASSGKKPCSTHSSSNLATQSNAQTRNEYRFPFSLCSGFRRWKSTLFPDSGVILRGQKSLKMILFSNMKNITIVCYTQHIWASRVSRKR